MNKVIKFLIIILTITTFFSIINTKKVQANSIEDINMNVYIDSNGNANVIETWKASLYSGTEGYRAYTKLGDSIISNFSVSDDNGKNYEILPSWNTSGTLETKAYKCGIHYINDGLELCWGISEYGNRTYTLKYTISNFITQYNDTQGIYFNFLNLKQNIGNARVTIYSDIPFNLDNARIWAFGNNGSINFEEGTILLESGGNLSSSQYMVGLVRFESNLFNTSNISKKSFDDIYDSAMSTVKKNQIKKKIGDILDSKITFYVIIGIVAGIPLLMVAIIIIKRVLEIIVKSFRLSPKFTLSVFGIVAFTLYKYPVVGIFLIIPAFILLVIVHSIKLSIKMSKANRKLPTLKNPNNILQTLGGVDYWREIPFEENIWSTALAASFFSDFNYKDRFLIGAVLLKWLKDGAIEVCETRTGLLNIKDNNYAVKFITPKTLNSVEIKLWNILKSAAGINNILEANELKKWCKKHYDKMFDWFKTSRNYGKEEARKQGFIKNNRDATSEFREEAKKLLGFRKFLLDFSLMPEREYFEVHLWENYLIYAEIMGIADKVEEQFSKIYPKFNELSKLNTDFSTLALRNLSYITSVAVEEGIKAAKDNYDKLEIKSSDYDHDYGGYDRDSGGGGSSYDSGGSSSGGSSGGGFR